MDHVQPDPASETRHPKFGLAITLIHGAGVNCPARRMVTYSRLSASKPPRPLKNSSSGCGSAVSGADVTAAGSGRGAVTGTASARCARATCSARVPRRLERSTRATLSRTSRCAAVTRSARSVNTLPSDSDPSWRGIDWLVRTSQSMPRHEGSESEGRVFTLRADRVTAAQRDVLESVARVDLSSRRGTLAEQVARAHRADAVPVTAPRPLPAAVTSAPETAEPHPELEFFNGLGGFDADSREYVTILRAGQLTPAPWINVIANPNFGCLVSEAGSGCTWSINSQENLLTAWSNDAVSDPPSEMFYIRDDDSGEPVSYTHLTLPTNREV